jgi:hypothetical protein
VATGVYTGGVTLPQPTRRPGSARLADVYPGLGPSTAATGGEGASREAAALAAGGAPLSIDVGSDFLARPAGWLVLGLAVLGVLSYLDR